MIRITNDGNICLPPLLALKSSNYHADDSYEKILDLYMFSYSAYNLRSSWLGLVCFVYANDYEPNRLCVQFKARVQKTAGG